ncbi:CIS tube protein [Persephonella sp.]
MGSSKAFIKILDGNFKDYQIYLQFNPSEYSVEKTNDFELKTSLQSKSVKVTYKKSEEGDLNLELLFDSTVTKKSLKDLLDPLKLITIKDSKLNHPPPVLVVWGDIVFKGIVSKISKKYTYFFSDGTPARARVSLVFKPFKTQEEIDLEFIKESFPKTVVVQEGDNLWTIAHKEYGDRSKWKLIAKENNIYDPEDIKPGQTIIIPEV